MRNDLHRSFFSAILILTHIFVFTAPPQAFAASSSLALPGGRHRAGAGDATAAAPAAKVAGDRGVPEPASHPPAIPEAAAALGPSGAAPAPAAGPPAGKGAPLKDLARRLEKAIPAPTPPGAHPIALSFHRGPD